MILSYTDIELCGSNVPGVRVKGLAGHDWTKHNSQWGGSAFVARYLVLFLRSRIETRSSGSYSGYKCESSQTINASTMSGTGSRSWRIRFIDRCSGANHPDGVMLITPFAFTSPRGAAHECARPELIRQRHLSVSGRIPRCTLLDHFPLSYSPCSMY